MIECNISRFYPRKQRCIHINHLVAIKAVLAAGIWLGSEWIWGANILHNNLHNRTHAPCTQTVKHFTDFDKNQSKCNTLWDRDYLSTSDIRVKVKCAWQWPVWHLYAFVFLWIDAEILKFLQLCVGSRTQPNMMALLHGNIFFISGRFLEETMGHSHQRDTDMEL